MSEVPATVAAAADAVVVPPPRTRLDRRVLRRVDGVLFAFAGVAAVWLAYLLARVGVRPGWPLLLLVPFWLVVTYLTLPRIHRVLTFLYVPGYFIGRTRTSDGLLGDPVNLAFRGSEAAVHTAMAAAGWTRADDLTLRTGWRIVRSTLGRRSYDAAPVSPLNLFDRQQDFAYEREVDGTPGKRHHVRFWRCPEGWFLPGGFTADWLAAGTYDKSVGLSLFTLQVTHKIEADTDVERDFIIETLRDTDPGLEVSTIRHFSSGYHARNGGGDRIETDGDLPIVEVGPSPDPPESAAPGRTDSRDKRPVQTIFGGVVAFFRSGLFGISAIGVLVAPAATIAITGQDADAAQELGEAGVAGLVAATLVAVAVAEAVLGLAILAGRNWARLLLMGLAVVTTVGAFASSVSGSKPVTLFDLPTIGTAVLLLLALSSHRARDFAARGRPMRKRVSASEPSRLRA